MKPTLLLFALTLHAACGGASPSPASPVDVRADSTTTSSADVPLDSRPSIYEIRIGVGPDVRSSEDWVESTVFVWWRDDAGEHEQHLLTIDAGTGEGAGDFARLDDLHWPEGRALLEANRPEGTVDTLFYNQGRVGWIGMHLVPSVGGYRLVMQRYVDERLVTTGEGAVTLEPVDAGYDVRSGEAEPTLALPELPEG